MKTTQSRVLLAISVLGVLYFSMYLPISGQGARDLNMLSVFSPDEFGQYPHLMRMLDQPAESFLQSIYRFIQYKHYYYGYPFFLFSAVFAVLPVVPWAGLEDISLNMLMLRQVVSILPILLSAALLVYMQTGFRKPFQSIFLFLFLLTVPIVLINNLWWHPESLVLLFVVLTFFFLQRDGLAFGRNFYLAACSCGLAAATKLIGLFFFIAIPVYIFMGWRSGRLNIRRAGSAAFQFVLLMTLTFVLGNPFLVFKSEREEALKIQTRQSDATYSGFVFSGDRSPASWIPVLADNYASPAFLILAFTAPLVGLLNRERRVLNLLILLWAIPFTLYLLFIVALRHKYYFMPVMLPLFSTLPSLLDSVQPEKWQLRKENILRITASLAVLGLLAWQTVNNFKFAADSFPGHYRKEADSEALQFFTEIESRYLSRIEPDRKLVILRDVRVYISVDPRWDVKYRWGLIHYGYVERIEPDVIVLWRQQVHDYTNVDAAASAVDPDVYAEALPFYQDARQGAIRAYVLLYENDFGLFFVSESLASEWAEDQPP